MAVLTYFAVLPFSRTHDGDFLAEAAIEVRGAVEARAMAARMEARSAARSRSARRVNRSWANGTTR
jgi:hypothetical protein